jgi:hypothetical protein
MSLNVTKRIPSALQHLHKLGADALKPTKIIDTTRKQQRWKKPVVSKRIAKTLRKTALRNGTYGSYDHENGVGWDPSWDEDARSGKINWMQIRPPKETKRERTREARATKIENLLEGADDKIAAFKLEQLKKKPEPGIESVLKRMSKAK